MLNFQLLKTTKCYGVTALWRCAENFREPHSCSVRNNLFAHNTKYPLFSLPFPKDLLSLQLNNIKTMTV